MYYTLLCSIMYYTDRRDRNTLFITLHHLSLLECVWPVDEVIGEKVGIAGDGVKERGDEI